MTERKSDFTCFVRGCERMVFSRGWCQPHYHRWWKHGDLATETPIQVRQHDAWRFWSKVRFTDSCWLWTAAKSGDGYGSFWVDGRQVRAHRFAYEFCVGPIPDGLQIDHLCRTLLCVRPDHLESVTSRENTLRGLEHRRKVAS